MRYLPGTMLLRRMGLILVGVLTLTASLDYAQTAQSAKAAESVVVTKPNPSAATVLPATAPAQSAAVAAVSTERAEQGWLATVRQDLQPIGFSRAIALLGLAVLAIGLINFVGFTFIACVFALPVKLALDYWMVGGLAWPYVLIAICCAAIAYCAPIFAKLIWRSPVAVLVLAVLVGAPIYWWSSRSLGAPNWLAMMDGFVVMILLVQVLLRLIRGFGYVCAATIRAHPEILVATIRMNPGMLAAEITAEIVRKPETFADALRRNPQILVDAVKENPQIFATLQRAVDDLKTLELQRVAAASNSASRSWAPEIRASSGITTR